MRMDYINHLCQAAEEEFDQHSRDTATAMCFRRCALQFDELAVSSDSGSLRHGDHENMLLARESV